MAGLRAMFIGGSPPLAWGQLRQLKNAGSIQTVHPHSRGDNDFKHPLRSLPLRFTPTRVGTTRSSAHRPRYFPVHPHSRGDNASRSGWLSGSSRFTPTRVGTTTTDLHSHCDSFGSPPLAWGQRLPVVLSWFSQRFTPTRVGTTTAVGSLIGE